MVESRGRSCRQDGASGPARCWSFCLEGEPGAEDRMGFHGIKDVQWVARGVDRLELQS